jgi:hypothetical protein
MVLPFDNTNVAQFMNFSKAGVNTLKQSSAFAKIRANSKLFTTNIVTNADQFALKYAKIHEYAFNDNNFSESLNYGNVRQHNLTSIQATKNVLSTFFNATEMDTYLTNKQSSQTSSTTKLLNLHNLLHDASNSRFKQQFTNLNTSLNSISTINSSSDSKTANHLLTSLVSNKLHSANLTRNNSLLQNTSSLPISHLTKALNTTLLNAQKTDLQVNLKGENTNILAADQLIRNYTNLTVGSSNYNLSPNNNSIAANINAAKATHVSQNSFTPAMSTSNLLLDLNFITKL